MNIEKRAKLLGICVLVFGGFLLLLSVTIFSQNVLQNLPFTVRPLAGADFPLDQKWSHNLSNSIINSVEYLSSGVNGTIIARTNDTLYSLQTDTGDILWSFPLTKQIYLPQTMVADGKVYVVDKDALWALDALTGEVIWERVLLYKNSLLVSASNTLVLVNQVSSILAYDAVSGNILWQLPVGRGRIQAYIDGEYVYIPDDGIMKVDSKTGEILETFGQDSIGSNDFHDGVIYYADTVSDMFFAFDVRQQIELWKVSIPYSGFPKVKVDNEYVLVGDSSFLYVTLRDDGTLVWKIEITFPQNPSLVGERLFVFGGVDHVIHAFDLRSGELVGSLRISIPGVLFVEDRRNMFSLDGLLIFARGDTLYSYGE